MRVIVFCVSILVSILQGSAWSASDPAVRCTSGKLRAAGQKARARLGCHARSEGTVDPECLARASRRFEERWRKLEAKGGCAATGDVAAAEARVDAFVDDFVASLQPTTSSTTTAPPTSSSMSTTTSQTDTTTTIVCVTTTGAFTLCGQGTCGPQGRCPQGQTCSEASAGCACVGDPIPCGDARLGVHCGYGACPPGFSCGGPAGCTTGAGLPCTCRAIP